VKSGEFADAPKLSHHAHRVVGNAEEIRELGSRARGPETGFWELCES